MPCTIRGLLPQPTSNTCLHTHSHASTPVLPAESRVPAPLHSGLSPKWSSPAMLHDVSGQTHAAVCFVRQGRCSAAAQISTFWLLWPQQLLHTNLATPTQIITHGQSNRATNLLLEGCNGCRAAAEVLDVQPGGGGTSYAILLAALCVMTGGMESRAGEDVGGRQTQKVVW